MNLSTLQVDIRKRDGLVFSGQVTSISSKNDVGVFDILPEHAHFVSIISEYVTVRTGQQSEKKFPLEKGILVVEDGSVRIFVGI